MWDLRSVRLLSKITFRLVTNFILQQIRNPSIGRSVSWKNEVFVFHKEKPLRRSSKNSSVEFRRKQKRGDPEEISIPREVQPRSTHFHNSSFLSSGLTQITRRPYVSKRSSYFCANDRFRWTARSASTVSPHSTHQRGDSSSQQRLIGARRKRELWKSL